MLLGHWKLNGNYKDSSGFGNHGTQTGGVTFAPGKWPEAASFDGVDDYVSVPGTFDFSTTNQLTISAWFYRTAATGAIIERWNDVGIRVDSGTGKIDAYIDTTAGSPTGGQFQSSSAVSMNAWHHVALVWDGSTEYLYIDGALDNTHTWGGTFETSASGMCIGCIAGGYFFTGKINDLRIYDTALLASDIRHLYRLPGITRRAHYLQSNAAEVFLDTLQRVGTTTSREIVSYRSHTSRHTKSFARYVDPTIYSMQGTMLYDRTNTADKLKYLAAIDDKVIMVADPDVAYGNIQRLVFNRDSPASMGLAFGFESSTTTPGQLRNCTTVSDCEASNGTSTLLDAQNEDVSFIRLQEDVTLPEGDYLLFARVRDTQQVANDLELLVYNDPDSSSIATSTETLSWDYDLYTLAFNIDSADAGDTIKLSISKDTATTNDIYIDFVGMVRT
ncbi:MAG: LamG domain-containing protein [Methanosarcinaceae archaeon]